MLSFGFLAAWLLYLAIANAQQMIQPSNVTSPPANWNDTQLILSFKQEGRVITYGVDIAINPWPWGTPGLNMSPNSLNVIGNPPCILLDRSAHAFLEYDCRWHHYGN